MDNRFKCIIQFVCHLEIQFVTVVLVSHFILSQTKITVKEKKKQFLEVIVWADLRWTKHPARRPECTSNRGSVFAHVLVCWDNRYWVLRIRLYTCCSLAHTWKTAQKATSSIAVKCDAGLWRLFPVPLTGHPASIPRMCTAFPLKKWFTHNWNLAHSRLSRARGCSDYYLFFFLLSFTLVKCLKLPVEVWEAAMCFGIFKCVEEAVIFRKCSLDFDYRFIILWWSCHVWYHSYTFQQWKLQEVQEF